MTNRIAFALFCVGFVTGISWSAAMGFGKWTSDDVFFEWALILGVMLVALGVVAKVGPWLIEREERRRWADEEESKQRMQSRLLH